MLFRMSKSIIQCLKATNLSSCIMEFLKCWLILERAKIPFKNVVLFYVYKRLPNILSLASTIKEMYCIINAQERRHIFNSI